MTWKPFTPGSLPAVDAGPVWVKGAGQPDSTRRPFNAANVHRYIALYGPEPTELWAPATRREICAWETGR